MSKKVNKEVTIGTGVGQEDLKDILRQCNKSEEEIEEIMRILKETGDIRVNVSFPSHLLRKQ